MATKPKRPRDPNQLAKLVIDIATGEVESDKPVESVRQQAGRKGGLRGGKSRMAALSAEERVRLAQRAAAVKREKATPANITGVAVKRSVKREG